MKQPRNIAKITQGLSKIKHIFTSEKEQKYKMSALGSQWTSARNQSKKHNWKIPTCKTQTTYF